MLISVEIIKDGVLWRRYQKIFCNLESRLCGRPTQLLFLVNVDNGTCSTRVFSDARISYNFEKTEFDTNHENEILGWCISYFCKILA